tara:strand:+ start:232 stop:549 length:318 start_codon:yes stop_codon:yes gene_type:complete
VWCNQIPLEVDAAQENLEVHLQHQEQEELPVPTGVSSAAQGLEPRSVPDLSAGAIGCWISRCRIQLPPTINEASEEEAVGSSEASDVPRPIGTHRHQHLTVRFGF